MSQNMRERNLEDDIERWLLAHGGYTRGDPAAFDRGLALDTGTLLRFVQTTQPREWSRHERNYPCRAEAAFLGRFCEAVRHDGLLHVLRRGFMDRGVGFRVVFWKPETTLNAAALELYAANVLHCTRQLHYSPGNENSVDMALFVNGIPVVCIELKNQITGQSVADAVRQYQYDRSPEAPFFAFKQRVLVCFAVDLYNVRMTTRLQGRHTVFLPFDQGSNGAGQVGGAGNPDPGQGGGHAVAHLWERVLCKDCLLELLRNYLHVERRERKTGSGKVERVEKLLFPRYHQWDVVSKLLAHVREGGVGHNYLVQHSAGSGKSNSIAWLAHRLSGLHDAGDNKIFHGVVIVTDRRVLDAQLQDTVAQFEHDKGLVVNIDKNSAQLRDALNDGAAIVITTLQKFPVIFEQVEHNHRKYAVIVDEAHSSQTGEAAAKLKKALGDTEAALAEFAAWEGRLADERETQEDERLRELASHGQHENLSFFAFTATPKDKTLDLFGESVPGSERKRAFHVYSMRQAIEEGFILDVLRNYTTYRTYYRLLKKSADDPRYATSLGAHAAMRFESLHPYNISQKTAVMLDHFLNITGTRIGGRAKAMLVTASRLHAVRYMKEFAAQIKAKHLTGVKALVAFSGEVVDTTGETYTEVGLNERIHGERIAENQLPARFEQEYNILIVAEKYQTGFDAPLLHTMFVDKPLASVKAVQTLSRLNRIAPDKVDTFVLDFVNTAEEIQRAFEPFYETTVLEEAVDPNIIYQIRGNLEEFRIFTNADVQRFDAALAQKASPQSSLARASATLAPVLDIYKTREEEEQRAFKTGLGRFNRLYNFVTQICRMFDEQMYVFALFAKCLARTLPRERTTSVDLDGRIDLEYYKLVKTSEGRIALHGSEKGYAGIKGEAGAGSKTEYDALSAIVERINERFATNFDPKDKVAPLKQIRDSLTSDATLAHLAQDGDENQLRMVYDEKFPAKVASIYDSNNEIFERLLHDKAFLEVVKEGLWQVVRAGFGKHVA